MKKLIIAIVTITILVVISTNYGKLYAMFFNKFSKDLTQKTANIDFTIQGDFKGEKKINIQNLDQLIKNDVKNYEIDIDFDIENNSDCEIYVRVAVVPIILDNTKANTAYKFSNSFCEIKYDSKNNTLDEDYWEKSDDGYYYYKTTIKKGGTLENKLISGIKLNINKSEKMSLIHKQAQLVVRVEASSKAF